MKKSFVKWFLLSPFIFSHSIKKNILILKIINKILLKPKYIKKKFVIFTVDY